jgi:hypothetical protein
MDAPLPKNQEEMNLWLFKKLNDMELSNETLHGDVRVSIANHDALKQRVGNIESDAKSAKNWENGKFLATYVLQGLIFLIRGKHGV